MLFFAITAAVVGSAPIDLTLDEFKRYRHYLNAMEDPRVQKMKPEARMSAIAKDAGFKLKDLQQAVERGEAAGDLEATCEANVREALAKTEVGSRLGKIDVDTSEPHAVGYLQWFNESQPSVEEEASIIAATAQPACPIVSTFQLWAQDKAAPNRRVFQGLVSAVAAQRIKLERVKDFADTRFIRLFEKVKNANAGDDLSAESGIPNARPPN